MSPDLGWSPPSTFANAEPTVIWFFGAGARLVLLTAGAAGRPADFDRFRVLLIELAE